MAKRTGWRNELPSCYFEGYLQKRSFKDKKSRRLYTCLCGNSLYFFNEKRDADYVERVDLCGFISITDDCSLDQKLDAARLNLQMKDGNVKLTASNAESRELWKGFIHSVAKLAVPPSLNLLPGQIHMLKEAVEKEKARIKNLFTPVTDDDSSYITFQPQMPACYYKVSRMEAEMLLEREAKRGNLLLRPGRDGISYSVTTRQDYGGAMFRHYRITRKYTGGFIIDVENPVDCATLQDAITFLVEQTNGVLNPLLLENTYEKSIEFIRPDNENGENSLHTLQKAQTPLVQPSLPPKPAAVNLIPPKKDAAGKKDLYLNETRQENLTEVDISSAPLPELQKKQTKTALKPLFLPPVPPKSTLLSASVLSSTNTNQRRNIILDSKKQMPLEAISELKQKFEKKLKFQE